MYLYIYFLLDEIYIYHYFLLPNRHVSYAMYACTDDTIICAILNNIFMVLTHLSWWKLRQYTVCVRICWCQHIWRPSLVYFYLGMKRHQNRSSCAYTRAFSNTKAIEARSKGDKCAKMELEAPPVMLSRELLAIVGCFDSCRGEFCLFGCFSAKVRAVLLSFLQKVVRVQ